MIWAHGPGSIQGRSRIAHVHHREVGGSGCRVGLRVGLAGRVAGSGCRDVVATGGVKNIILYMILLNYITLYNIVLYFTIYYIILYYII